MTDHTTHLTEDERQTAADESLSAERRPDVEAHLAACDACAADVARIAEFMKRSREATAALAEPALDDLWSPIRSRIEATKVVALDPAYRSLLAPATYKAVCHSAPVAPGECFVVMLSISVFDPVN